MGDIIELGEPPIPVALRRSARARRLSLRVSRVDGSVSLSLPRFASEREARVFLSEKESWIRKHLARAPSRQRARFGSTVPYMGEDCPIIEGSKRRAQFREGAFELSSPEETLGPRLQAFLKLDAGERLRAASDHYAALLGVSYTKLSLRDTRSRWGSCTTDGALMYSWRLAMAPHAVLDYVAAHEVAHLREMNHSSRFWSLVADVCPDYVAHKDWLKRHGDKLQAWDFKSD